MDSQAFNEFDGATVKVFTASELSNMFSGDENIVFNSPPQMISPLKLQRQAAVQPGAPRKRSRPEDWSQEATAFSDDDTVIVVNDDDKQPVGKGGNDNGTTVISSTGLVMSTQNEMTGVSAPIAKMVREVTQSTRWCFTWNNYPSTYMENVEDLKTKYQAKFVIIGREKAPSTGTPHLQGFVVFRTNKRGAAVKKMIDCHWEVTKSTTEAAFKYCQKDGDWTVIGEAPVFHKDNGEREKNRWEVAKDNSKAGVLDDIDPQIFVSHYTQLFRIKQDYMAKPDDAQGVCGLWIQGPAGCGKSRKARELYPNAYFHGCSKWSDGLQDKTQPWIIDDFDKNHACLGHHLKIWGDRYSFISEIKGGSIHVRPARVVVTSQYRIDDIWQDEETRDAIKRRFEVLDMFPPMLFPIFNRPEDKVLPVHSIDPVLVEMAVGATPMEVDTQEMGN